MESSYELRKYPNGDVRLECKEYSELLSPELRGEVVVTDEKRDDASK